MNTCSGTPAGPGGAGYYYSWSVENTGIASISGSASNYDVSLYGASVGSTYLNGEASDDYCLQYISPPEVPVTPTLSLSNALFYNGGLALPSTFTEAATSAVVTAIGGGSGSYSWSLSSSSGSIASFSSSASVTSTTNSSNTITVYAAGASKSTNDLTISLTYTPSEGTPLMLTTATGIDSPYQLSFVAQTPLIGVQQCSTYAAGNNGWETQFTWEMMSFFGNPLFGMSLNEQFTNITVYQSPGYGYTANGQSGVSGRANFTDTYCAAHNPDGSITTMPPQNPLLTNPVDSATQTYRLGSSSVGSGTSSRCRR
jgi:hypothetical protein